MTDNLDINLINRTTKMYVNLKKLNLNLLYNYIIVLQTVINITTTYVREIVWTTSVCPILHYEKFLSRGLTLSSLN